MRLGVKSGMVRSVYNCKSGLNAFKQHFKKTTKDNNPNDILEEPHVKRYREELYIEALSDDDTREWLRMKGKTVSASIDEALVEGQSPPVSSQFRKNYPRTVFH
jgi:succinyl-CoA synthetase beta subunit